MTLQPAPRLVMHDATDDQLEQLLKEAEGRLVQAHSTDDFNTSILPVAPSGNAPERLQISSQKPNDGGPEKSNKDALSLRQVEPRAEQSSRSRKDTAGPAWFGISRTNLTPDLKRDLQLLRMRSAGVLDPKRFYKKESRRAAVPEYSHVGTIVEGPTEFYSARLTRRERRETLVDQVLETERASGRLRRRALEVSKQKASGKHGFYKKLVARRRKTRT